MVKKVLLCSAGIMCVSLVSCLMKQARAQTAIIDRGAAKATIYVGAKAPSTVLRAATDLQSHLKQISDVELPVTSDPARLKGFVIYLGDTEAGRKLGIQTSKLAPDGFRIVSTKNALVIAGKDYDGPVMTGFENPYRINESYSSKLKMGAFGDAGTLFGVYHFLEQYCGVRWYMPGPLGTVIQRKNKVVVPASLNISKSPFFPQRHCYYGFFDVSDDDTLWYRRAGYGSPAPVLVQHSFGPFFGKYRESHPEWFAIIDGKPDLTNRSTAENLGNPNLSNPEFVKQAIIDANAYFDEHPEQMIYPLCPSDGMTRISEDPVSQAQIDKSQGPGGLYSNYIWGFINKVAKGIQQKHPDKFVGGFAYEKYALPPTNIEKLEPNVVLVITRMRSQSYNSAEAKKALQDRMLNWKKKVNTIYTWEWYCNVLFNSGWRGYPMFFSKKLQEDMRFLKGVSKGEFIEAESWGPEEYGTAPQNIKINYPGVDHLLLYSTARLLWNPDLDMKAMLDEYYKLFYGPAEKEMRAFWELVDATWDKKGWQNRPSLVYDTATNNKLSDSLDAARAKTAADSIYRKRIDLIIGEFSPAAQVAARLASLVKPGTEVSTLKTPAVAEDGAPVPALAPGSPVLSFLDRKHNAASPATNVQLAWDKDSFYVDLRCYEPNMAKLKVLATKRDSAVPAIWEDDGVEIFLTPDAANPENPAKTVHYIVTAGGALFDSRIGAAGIGENTGWDGNAKVTVRREADRWIARLSIPWKDLDVASPKAGDTISANFYRSRYAGGELIESGWAPLKDASFYSPNDFGVLTLRDKIAEAPAAANPAVIQPTNNKEYGSGSARIGFYYDGGIPNTGLFVGQANASPRDDRALFKFDLATLLEEKDRIESVHLQFGILAVFGKNRERQIDVRYFPQTVGKLDTEVLGSEETKSVALLKATPAITFGAASVAQQEYVPQRIDVTQLVKEALTSGRTSITFRWQDVQAEKEGPETDPVGIILSENGNGGLPALIVNTK